MRATAHAVATALDSGAYGLLDQTHQTLVVTEVMSAIEHDTEASVRAAACKALGKLVGIDGVLGNVRSSRCHAWSESSRLQEN